MENILNVVKQRLNQHENYGKVRRLKGMIQEYPFWVVWETSVSKVEDYFFILYV